jgi:hypothetical protein
VTALVQALLAFAHDSAPQHGTLYGYTVECKNRSFKQTTMDKTRQSVRLRASSPFVGLNDGQPAWPPAPAPAFGMLLHGICTAVSFAPAKPYGRFRPVLFLEMRNTAGRALVRRSEDKSELNTSIGESSCGDAGGSQSVLETHT